MKFSEYAEYDGLGLAQLVAKKEVSSAELAECARSAIEKENPRLNAFISALDGQPFDSNGPFGGVPFAIKELALQARGAMCRSGCRAAPAERAPADTNLMQRFRSAGLQLVGTTQSPEMGYNATTETVAFGPVHNPWKSGHSAGGSSGGSGAAVAAGLIPVAHANDGGGSIRIPASCNGLVGLKPSRDRVPSGPYYADPLMGQAVEFVVSRSVRDSAALLDCVSGPDIGAPHLIAPPTTSFANAASQAVEPLKIALETGSLVGTAVHDDISGALDRVGRELESLGHTLIENPVHLDFDEFSENVNLIWCTYAAQFVDYISSLTGTRADNDSFEAVTLTCAEFGAGTTALQLLSALDYFNRITRETAQAFEAFDVLVSPTMGSLPATHGFLDQNDPNVPAIEWTRKTFSYAPNTAPFNSTGQPAISLPLHWTEGGLPVGVQFVGKMGDEGLLLSLASQIEQHYDWKKHQRQLWQ